MKKPEARHWNLQRYYIQNGMGSSMQACTKWIVISLHSCFNWRRNSNPDSLWWNFCQKSWNQQLDTQSKFQLVIHLWFKRIFRKHKINSIEYYVTSSPNTPKTKPSSGYFAGVCLGRSSAGLDLGSSGWISLQNNSRSKWTLKTWLTFKTSSWK